LHSCQIVGTYSAAIVSNIVRTSRTCAVVETKSQNTTGESLGKCRIATEFRREDLQGDDAVEARLADLVNKTHAALADQFDHFPLRKRGGDFLQWWRAVAMSGWLLGIAEQAGGAEPARRVGRDGNVAGGAVIGFHTHVPDGS
jgi:hypothetical protein